VLAYQFLASSVVDGRVDEVDSGVQDRVEDGACVLIGNFAPSGSPTDLHRSVSKLGDLEARSAQNVLGERLVNVVLPGLSFLG
jgi:hypothetical protein